MKKIGVCITKTWLPFVVQLQLFFCLLLIVFLSSQVSSVETNYTFEALDEIQKMTMIKEYLQMINKPAKKTILSSDGDIVDCVLFNKQPAFDNPLLNGKIPKERPKRTNGLQSTSEAIENFQVWNANGEKCPEGTIPIKRITEKDVLRAPLLARFRKKPYMPFTTNDDNNDHEYAITFTPFGRYFGAKATLNIWAPQIGNPGEFSLSQIWVLAGKFGVDLNSVEVGWHTFPQMYGDARPRFFVFWTADAYAHGCYNLECPGFVQTSSKIVFGATISPVSTYNGRQYDITIAIEKDPKNGNWLLLFGSNREEIGYWPSHLFTHLKDSASMVQFGGEIFNTRPSGVHTATQMGSGHFPREKFGKAAFVRNLEVLGSGNVPLSNLGLKKLTTHPSCYDIQLAGTNKIHGTYFYFGGPGLSNSCR